MEQQQEIAAFIDVEGTGLHEPEPVEVAVYVVPDGPQHWPVNRDALWCQRYEPSKPIELGAVATHHIIPSDLHGCPPSSAFQLAPGIRYLIGHNIDYDWEVIGKPNVRRIDTYALAKHLWLGLDSYKLTALMFARFGVTPQIRDRVKQAHGAAPDVLMLIDVYYELLDTADELGLVQLPTTWAALWELSEDARVPLRMEFGKYGPNTDEGGPEGMLIEDLRRFDKGYVKWLLANACDDKPYLRKALTR